MHAVLFQQRMTVFPFKRNGTIWLELSTKSVRILIPFHLVVGVGPIDYVEAFIWQRMVSQLKICTLSFKELGAELTCWNEIKQTYIQSHKELDPHVFLS